jgi:hypothetical protein
MTLFASVYLDREPMQWAHMGAAFMVWLQNAGAVAAFGIILVLIAGYLQRDARSRGYVNLPTSTPGFAYAGYLVMGMALLYAFLIVCFIANLLNIRGANIFLPRPHPSVPPTYGDWILAGCGAVALLIALTPVAIDLVSRISFGRIWAIARLSWKEAIRGRVVWVFGIMALVFLFADWFVPYKAENQLRNYVRVVYWSMTPLFLLTAGVLGSFSIPNDVKNNSIHTIVTKPVETFEIVLGRFLGYGAILTIGLFAVSSVSLIYVVRGVNEEATKESFKARLPVYGKLQFAGTKNQFRGDSVGREWTYRSYITGPTRRTKDVARQYAIWDFAEVSDDIADRKEPLLYEFAFDIFRLSKGDEEGKGVYCTFSFTDGSIQPERMEAQANIVKEERDKRSTASGKEIENFIRAVSAVEGQNQDRNAQARAVQTASDALAESRDERFKAAIQGFGDKYARAANEAERQRLLTGVVDEASYVIDRAIAKEFHIYQARSIEVTDYHTQFFVVPPGVLKALGADKRRTADDAAPPLRVLVSVDFAREAQMVGVAQQDFYLVAHEMPFWQNFLKGIVGMWCTHMLILGVAICLSTYFSSVISFLGTMFLYLTGMNVEYLREIAEKRIDGGGPTQSLIRITSGLPIAAKLDESPTASLVFFVDDLFSWWIGRILNLLPDVSRHDLHQYVANGFDISWLDVLLLDNFLPVAGYLTPWLVLAYYLMKYREIANPS